MSEHHELDVTTLRARLASSTGPDYWRSLEELAGTEEFQTFLHREFPEQASEFTDPVGRRQFLRLMGASLALAGVGACTKQPAESIVPYVHGPEEIVPGKPLFFATAVPFGGFDHGEGAAVLDGAAGILVLELEEQPAGTGVDAGDLDHRGIADQVERGAGGARQRAVGHVGG